MGCDIHTLAQIKRHGKWHTVAVNIADEPRDYETFALMSRCGRRMETTPFVEPRGLPTDLGHEVDGDHYANVSICVPGMDDYEREYPGYWLGDHSHSWLTLSEMRTHPPHDSASPFRLTLFDYIEELEKLRQEWAIESSEDVRIVFGFDN